MLCLHYWEEIHQSLQLLLHLAVEKMIVTVKVEQCMSWLTSSLQQFVVFHLYSAITQNINRGFSFIFNFSNCYAGFTTKSTETGCNTKTMIHFKPQSDINWYCLVGRAASWYRSVVSEAHDITLAYVGLSVLESALPLS